MKSLLGNGMYDLTRKMQRCLWYNCH